MNGKTGLFADLGDYIQAKMPEWNTPGIAVGVTQGEKIIYSAGFGSRDREQGLPVTPQTLFGNASTSKAFTATALAMLVDSGLLSWDTPVREYLPRFRLLDPWAADQVTLRDMLSHRTGMPRHDKVWYNSTAPRRELVDSLGYLEPNCAFRTTYQYNNLMYVTAGYILEQVTGQSWEEFIRARIFAPLGMNRSNFSVLTSQQSGDYALPYETADGKITPIPFRVVDNLGPAGGINSCVEDMLIWLQFLLRGGVHAGQRLVSEKNLRETQSPQMLAQSFLPGQHPEVPLSAYGMGWFIEPYRGYRTVYHVGSLDGFYAYISLLPEADTGVVVFTNTSPNRLPYALCYRIYDRLLGLPEIDWSGRLLVETAKANAEEERQRAAVRVMRDEKKPPSLPLAAYTGDYQHPGYGQIAVCLKDGVLQYTFNSITVPLRHNHGDTFEAEGNIRPFRPVMTLTFKTAGDGTVSQLTAPFEPAPGAKAIVFGRV